MHIPQKLKEQILEKDWPLLKKNITIFEPPPFSCPCRLSGNPAWSIDGFRAIGNPPSVFHATVVLNRVSKKAGFIVWLKKKSGKRQPKINPFQSDERHKIIGVPILPLLWSAPTSLKGNKLSMSPSH
jgi:hypothetical protein